MLKAKLKVNYSEAKKGDFFSVSEIAGKRVTLIIGNRKVDFGFSEVEVVTNTNSDLYYLGRYLSLIDTTVEFLIRNIDIDNHIKQICLPIKKSLMRKSIHHYIWN